MDIQVIRYPEADQSAKRDVCPKIIEEGTLAMPEGCTDVGDVFVGDTGFSTNCERGRVLAEVSAAGCQLGADVAIVRKLNDPQSSCYQARARLLRCPPAAEEAAR